MATKAKTPKARITMERVHVPGSHQKEFDFVRTPTMCQTQWQTHINKAHEKLTYKTGCWCINASVIELPKVKNILVSWSVHPDHSNKVFMESRYNQNIAWWARAIRKMIVTVSVTILWWSEAAIRNICPSPWTVLKLLWCILALLLYELHT